MKKAKARTNGEILPLKHLRPDANNANRHTERGSQLMQHSLEQCGFGDSLTVDKNGVVISGNQRLETLADIGMEQAIVVKTDGKRPIVHQRTDLDLMSDPKARLLSFYSNRVGELNLDWIPDRIAELPEEERKRLWTEAELRALLGDTASEGPAAQIDKAAELQVKWGTARGQVWEVGKHRLMCGDCTEASEVATVMDGKRAGLMNTDPPYGVSYANDERPNPGVAKPRVANDDLKGVDLQAFLERAFRPAVSIALTENAAWYMWHPMLLQGYFAAAAAAAAGLIIHRQIIWVKPVLLLGRGHYHWKHELCFMGWVQGHEPPDYGRGNGERDQTTVWEVDSVSNADREAFGHSTPKPTELFSIPIVKHLREGEICYEPFAGSGSQFVAAEQRRCVCFGMDIEPKFCAVILQRLADMHLEPKLVSGP